MKKLIVLLIVAILMIAATAVPQAYDSGWVRIPNGSTSHFYHGIGALPDAVHVNVAMAIGTASYVPSAYIPSYDYPGVSIEAVTNMEIGVFNGTGNDIYVQVVAQP